MPVRHSILVRVDEWKQYAGEENKGVQPVPNPPPKPLLEAIKPLINGLGGLREGAPDGILNQWPALPILYTALLRTVIRSRVALHRWSLIYVLIVRGFIGSYQITDGLMVLYATASCP